MKQESDSKEYSNPSNLNYSTPVPVDIAKKELATSIYKLLLAKLPFGTIIYEATVDYHRRVKNARLTLFIEHLKEFFENVNGDTIEPEFLKSEDFAQLFDRVIKKVLETKSEEKIKVFRDILAANINARHVSDFSETFLNLIGQLHETQIEILRSFRHVDVTHHVERYELSEKNRERAAVEALAKTELEQKNAGFANDFSKFESQLDIIDNEIDNLQSRVNKITLYTATLKANHFGITESIYNFYLQDLVSKALLMDMSSKYYQGINAFSEVCISEFGKHLLDFIDPPSL